MIAKARVSSPKRLHIAAAVTAGLSACATQKPTRSGFLTAQPPVATPQGRYRATIIEPVAYRPTGKVPERASDVDMAMLQSPVLAKAN